MKEEKYTCDICQRRTWCIRTKWRFWWIVFVLEDCLRRNIYLPWLWWQTLEWWLADGDIAKLCYDEDYVRCEDDAVTLWWCCYYEMRNIMTTRIVEIAFDMDEIIHDYYYKAWTDILRWHERYLGVELELDDGGENEFCASKLLDYCKCSKRAYVHQTWRLTWWWFWVRNSPDETWLSH